jgi:hypothetical protein
VSPVVLIILYTINLLAAHLGVLGSISGQSVEQSATGAGFTQPFIISALIVLFHHHFIIRGSPVPIWGCSAFIPLLLTSLCLFLYNKVWHAIKHLWAMYLLSYALWANVHSYRSHHIARTVTKSIPALIFAWRKLVRIARILMAYQTGAVATLQKILPSISDGTEVFCGFPKFIQANTTTLSSSRSQLLLQNPYPHTVCGQFFIALNTN